MKLFILILLFCIQAFATSTTDIGLGITSGNTETKLLTAKTANSFPLDSYILKLDGNYNYGKAKKIVNTDNWMGKIRGEKEILFLSEQLLSNKLSGIELRSRSDLGIAYDFIKDSLKGEASLVYFHQTETTGKSRSTYGFALLGGHTIKLQSSATIQTTIEYLQSLQNTKLFLINPTLSISTKINDILGLKISEIYQFINTPPRGKKKWDQSISTALTITF